MNRGYSYLEMKGLGLMNGFLLIEGRLRSSDRVSKLTKLDEFEPSNRSYQILSVGTILARMLYCMRCDNYINVG